MRTYDLTPFYRSTVGFDRFFNLLDQAASDGSPGYPPYNIERTGENTYRISVAVSGFAQGELSIVAKENTLTIKGEKTANENGKDNAEVLYRGIAARAFERQRHPIRRAGDDMKALALQPSLRRLVRVDAGTETRRELSLCQVTAVRGRGWIVQIAQEGVETGLIRSSQHDGERQQ